MKNATFRRLWEELNSTNFAVETQLRWTTGVLPENLSAERVHNFRQSLRKANPSIYLIDKGCMLHESGYNVHYKSFLVYGERPCTISHAALSTVSNKDDRIWT